MKTIIILTTAMAMTMPALAIPFQNIARDSILVPTPTTKLLPPDTTLVSTPTSKLLPPSESAEMVHVQIRSTNKVVATVTPAPSASSSSTPKVQIIPSLMNSLGLGGVVGSLSSLMTGQ